MKKIIFCLLCCVMMTQAVFAASMCVKNRGATDITVPINDAVEGNRGKFITGANCIAELQTCRNIYYRGDAHCSASPVYPADNWEEFGKYCYCKLTDVRAPNGYLAPFPGMWVISKGFEYGNDACLKECAGYCIGAGGIFFQQMNMMRMGD